MLVHWIWLSTRPKLNDREKARLLEHFQDPEDIYFADPGVLAQTGLDQDALDALADRNLAQAEQILRQCADKQIHLLTLNDAAYPHRLKNIPDPPLVLYYKGTLPDFDGSPLVAVVGTRKATPYGITIAKRMGYDIAKSGGILVSGMAYGIDGIAMQGALSAGGQVVGVLGCGVDIVYPRSNASLFADTQIHGCLLSEFPPETEPFGWNFPKRNRIISGISCGVVVVEAPEKSGSLITARQAAEQGRDVFAVPGNVDVPTFAGSNSLIRDGAIFVQSGWDVMSEYQALFPGKIHKPGEMSRLSGYPDEAVKMASEAEKPAAKVAQKPTLPWKKEPSKPKKDKKTIDNGGEAPYIDVNAAIKNVLPSLTPEEQKVLDLVSGEGCLVDDVIAGSGLPAGQVLSALTLLQIKGAVANLPGKRVRRL